jgi:hypothetical protein
VSFFIRAHCIGMTAKQKIIEYCVWLYYSVCMSKLQCSLLRSNRAFARQLWGSEITKLHLASLSEITKRFGFSVGQGDIRILDGKWYVTHAGLLSLARRKGCAGISTEASPHLSAPDECRWVFRANVYTRNRKSRFSGYGDANPSNVSPMVRGAEMRIAETRAVNRALRKAYGIGLCSVEELGWSARDGGSRELNYAKPINENGHGHYQSNVQPRLRDQLCLLIRQYNLDPNLVKVYAAHFCGTETLKEASRDLVQSFISHLAASAKDDRDGLICKLNSFVSPVEVQP